MLLKDVRLFFSDERRHPDGRLEAALANLFQNALHVAAKRRAGLEPVAHRRLIAVVDLHVTQAGRVFRDEVEIVEHLLCAVTRGPKQYHEHQPVGGVGKRSGG